MEQHSATILAALRRRDAVMAPLLKAARSWRTASDDIQQRQKNIDDLQAMVLLRREENKQFAARISQLQQPEEDHKIQAQLAQLDKEITDVTQELYDIYSSVGRSEGEFAFRKELDSKQRELASLTQQIEQAQAHNAELEATCAQLVADRDKFERQFSAVREEHDAMQIPFVEAERQLRMLRTENEELIGRILSLKQQQVELMNESNARVTQLKAAALKSELLDASSDVDLLLPSIISRVPECEINAWDAHVGDIIDLCAIGGGVASASQDKRVKIWDPTGKCMLTLTGHTMGVTRLSVAPSGSLLASCSFDRTVQIWTAAGRCLHHLNGHSDKVHSVVFAQDSVHLFSTSQDHTLKCWDANRGVFEASVVCPSTAIDLARAGSALLAAHHDRKLRLWDPRTRNIDHEIPTSHSLPLMSMAVTSDASYCVVTARDSTASIIDLRTLDTIAVWSSAELRLPSQFARPSISPDDRYVALGTETGQVHFWDLLAGKPDTIAKRDHDSAPIYCCAWTRGYEVVTGGSDHMLRMWGCRV